MTSISYDYENRVTGITYPGGATNSFAYNGDDMRMQKVDSTGTFNYVCDGTAPASSVLSDSNAIYTPGLSERRSSTSKFYHGDNLGSTRGITNSSQTVTDAIRYDAFGNTISRTGTTPTPFGFVGKGQYQTDSDSGLMLLGHRYYDASVGRFISSDPAKAGNNWYAYCDNNPLKKTDAQGLSALIGGIGGAIIGGAIGFALGGPAGMVWGAALGGSAGAAWGSALDGNSPGQIAIDAGTGFFGGGLAGALLAPVAVSAMAFAGVEGAAALGGAAAAGGAATGGQTAINIGGEGEVPGVTNVQGPWVWAPGWTSSTFPGKTLGDLESEGHVFQRVESMAEMPYADASVDRIYTNNIPVGGVNVPPGHTTMLGPVIDAGEIQRILAPGGEWRHNGELQ